MTGDTEHIMMTLFGTGKLEEVPIHELKELVQTFPSFNIAHYLLSKRLDQEKDEESRTANLKTALYFNNPFWLQWLLQNTNEEQKESVENNPAFTDVAQRGFSFDYPRREQPRSWETDIPGGQDPPEKEETAEVWASMDDSKSFPDEASAVENLVSKEESLNTREEGIANMVSTEEIQEVTNPSEFPEQVLNYSVNLENSEMDRSVPIEEELKKNHWQED
jgi:hypothetical protein